MTYLDARRPRPRHVDHEAGGTRAPHGHGSLHVPATKLILLSRSFFLSFSVFSSSSFYFASLRHARKGRMKADARIWES